MQELQQKIESILFLESKPISIKKLAQICEASLEDTTQAVEQLHAAYTERAGGVSVLTDGGNVQIMTSTENAEFIRNYLHQEETGELSRPSLETLTIVAYRGPVSKSEIELIRGVNCSLILRNLMIRGLVEEVGETETGSPIYRVTIDFLRFLGVTQVSELPDYEELNKNVHLQELLAAQQNPDDFFVGQTEAQS